MEVTLYNIQGKETGKIQLVDELFGVTPNPGLVHEAFVAQEANGRVRISQTKDRSEVRGGGRKPWRQKGTGRARHGSRRSPIWSGGGVTFGPLAARVFRKKINKRAKRKALAMVLSDKVQSNAFIVVDDLKLAEAKTKHVNAFRKVLPGADSSALIVVSPENKEMHLAARNLPKTAAISATSVNLRDLLKYQYTIISSSAVEMLTKQYSK